MKIKRTVKMKTDYSDDLRIIPDIPALIFTAVFTAFFVILPFFASSRMIYIITLIMIYSIAVLGQNILIGYTGLISFGQSGFLAVGAYAFAHSIDKIGLLPALLLSGIFSSVIGAIVGIPSVRLKGPFLAISTLGFSIATFQVILNTPQISGGRMGIFVPKKWGIDSPLEIYYLCLFFTYFFYIVGYRIIKSHIGKIFLAIRESDLVAEVLGVNVVKFKILSFVISSFYTGFAGGLYAYFFGYLEPTMFSISESINIFAAIVIGGLGSVIGSLLGTAFVISIPQIFVSLKEYAPIIFALAIILAVIFEPLGLYGRWLKIKLYFMNFPFR